MSGIQLLRVVVNERLSAAAEEIFEAVRKTIAGYEQEILQSKQEIRRQRTVLQGVLYPKIKISEQFDRDSGDEGPSASSGHHNQPHMTFSVWYEDFLADQKQNQERSPSQATVPPETKMSQGVQLQESKEDNDMKFIITPPCAENRLKQIQPCSEGEADHLPITSEQHQMVVEADDGASSSTSVAECDSNEDWIGNMGSQSDNTNSKSKKTTGPCLPMAQKRHPNKKGKSRICCKVCKKTFHAIVSLVNHIEAHPKDVCGVCGEHFENEDGFDVHLKTHVKAGVCSLCGKCFGSGSSLEMHMRIHTGEKPFLCRECGKSFNCRHNMTRHIRTHTGEKPYVCNICGRRFGDHSALKQHISTHTGEKAHRCDVCGRGFHRKTVMRLHMKNHAAEK